MKWTCAFLWAVLPSCPASAAPAASDAKEVQAVIERSVHSVLDILKDKGLDREERKKRVLSIVDPVFDLPLMGKLVLGRTHWPSLSEPQRKDFTGLFIKAIHDSYFEKIDLFTDETVEFEAPVPREKGKFEMATRIASKGQRYKLLYKLYRGESSWRVYDFEIEGISLVRTYGSQYDQVLQKHSIDELLKKMREKALEVPAGLKRAAKEAAKPEPAAKPGGKP